MKKNKLQRFKCKKQASLFLKILSKREKIVEFLSYILDFIKLTILAVNLHSLYILPKYD